MAALRIDPNAFSLAVKSLEGPWAKVCRIEMRPATFSRLVAVSKRGEAVAEPPAFEGLPITINESYRRGFVTFVTCDHLGEHETRHTLVLHHHDLAHW